MFVVACLAKWLWHFKTSCCYFVVVLIDLFNAWASHNTYSFPRWGWFFCRSITSLWSSLVVLNSSFIRRWGHFYVYLAISIFANCWIRPLVLHYVWFYVLSSSYSLISLLGCFKIANLLVFIQFCWILSWFFTVALQSKLKIGLFPWLLLWLCCIGRTRGFNSSVSLDLWSIAI